MNTIDDFVQLAKDNQKLKEILDQISLEQAIDNAKYCSDWHEQRQIIAKIIEFYIQHADWYHKLRNSLGDDFIQFMPFHILGKTYVWVDVVNDGKLIGSQLEFVLNEYASRVLYSLDENAAPLAATMYAMHKEGKLFNCDNR